MYTYSLSLYNKITVWAAFTTHVLNVTFSKHMGTNTCSLCCTVHTYMHANKNLFLYMNMYLYVGDAFASGHHAWLKIYYSRLQSSNRKQSNTVD